MNFFSRLGNDMFLPQDVLIQSKETAQVGDAINATIGMAMNKGKIMKLNSMEEAIKNVSYEDYLPYAPTPGQLSVRSLWKEKIIKENPNINPDYLSEPIATTGITQGIDLVGSLFSEKNDALLIPDLHWPNYDQIFKINLETSIYKYHIFNNGKYCIDTFKNALYDIQENKISILLNFPNNPTGYTPSKEEFEQLVTVLKEFLQEKTNKKIIILCDDAYFGLFFEENHKNSTLNYLAPLVELDNCLIAKIDGITKEYYAWGLRLGFVTFYIKDKQFRNLVTEKAQGFIRISTSSGSNLAQAALKEIINQEITKNEKLQNDNIIEERYKTLLDVIKKEELDKIATILPFNSGYFFTMKLPERINAHQFRVKLLYDYKIGVYSMDDCHIRIAFSCIDKEDIPTIIKNIKLCINDF